MPWNDGLTELQYELADLYFRDERIRSVAVEAGIPQEVLDLGGAPVSDWHNVLREAANRDKVANLVAIASDEYPLKSKTLNAALEKHQRGVGAFSSALADFNRTLSDNLRRIVASVIVAIITAWIMTSSEGIFFRREFVILLLFSVLLFTPFLLRAVFTRFRIPIGMVSLTLISALLMMGEAAIFSEFMGGPRPDLANGESVERMTTGDPKSIQTVQFPKLDSYELKATKRNTVTIKIKDENPVAVAKIQENHWAAPFLYVQLDLEWKARDPGFPRNYRGRVLFVFQYVCNEGVPEFRRVDEQISFRPGKDLRSWLVGFAQIPYLDRGELEEAIKTVLTSNKFPCNIDISLHEIDPSHRQSRRQILAHSS